MPFENKQIIDPTYTLNGEHVRVFAIEDRGEWSVNFPSSPTSSRGWENIPKTNDETTDEVAILRLTIERLKAATAEIETRLKELEPATHCTE